MELINNERIFSHLVKEDAKLFDYLKKDLILSYRQTNAFIKNKTLLINGKAITKNIAIQKADTITLIFDDEANEYLPEDIQLDIIYETIDLLIINKLPHILVHPTNTVKEHTIANAISYYFNKINLKRKIRFVNRLDQDTSGILIIAKNAYAHSFLAKQFENDQITKKYLTIIEGHLKVENGVIETNLGKVEDDIKYHANDTGKASKTIYKVIKELESFSLVECELKSGRTHQIRVSLKCIGGYILGDTLYNQKSDLIKRQALHAYKLEFIEPRTLKRIEIFCDLPTDMKNLVEVHGESKYKLK